MRWTGRINFITARCWMVAPQLTVVSAPPLNKAFERMRGTPTLLGWCPTRRRYVVRQQFSDTPAMIGDASSHGRCGLATGLGQTRVRCAKIIDGTDEIHTVLQCQRAARQRAPSACQRGEPLTERRVEPLDVRRIDDPVALRAPSERLDASRRAIDNAAGGLNHPSPLVALHDLGDQDMTPRTQAGPSALPRGCGIAKGLPNGPDVGHQPVGADQQGTGCGTAADPLD